MKKALIIILCFLLCFTVILVACNSEEEYSVTFIYGDNKSIVQSVKQGHSAIAPEDTAKSQDEYFAYVFEGWDKEFDNITHDITVVAIYKKMTIAQGLSVEPVEDGYKISGCNSSLSRVITIPSVIAGQPVTEIAERAFMNYSELEELVIPKSVRKIGKGALSGCDNLKAITLPVIGGDDVTQFGYIFDNDSNLAITSIDVLDARVYRQYALPQSLTKVVFTGQTVPKGAFYNCESLTEIQLTDNVTLIQEDAFNGCKGLSEIILPVSLYPKWKYLSEGIEVVSPFEKNAFANCDKLEINAEFSLTIKDVIGDDVYEENNEESWFHNLFGKANPQKRPVIYECNFKEKDGYSYVVHDDRAYITGYAGSETSLVIPQSFDGANTIAIMGFTFFESEGIESVQLPATLQCLDDCAFLGYGFNELQFAIDGNLRYIGNLAFFGSSFTELNLPDSLIEIGDCTFAYSEDLSVTIPQSVKKIGNGAFAVRKEVNLHKDNTEFVSQDGIIYNKDKTRIKYVPIDSAGRFLIPDTVDYIEDCTFMACYELTDVVISNSVKGIGRSAFESCEGLVSLSIPNNVTFIGDSAFAFCSSLISIDIPDKAIYASGFNAFRQCSALSNITIPSSVTFIGGWSFVGCSSLISIIIPEGITSIGVSAFAGCSSLTSITIPDSVTTISDNAFGRCSSLTSITIPGNVTSIGDWAFDWCSSLTSITIPDSVTTIGGDVFNCCSSLTINCKVEQKPAGWDDDWNCGRPVVWGYKG